MRDLLTFCDTMVDQLCVSLTKIAPDKYQMPLPLIMGASIGQHYRHIIEFFVCFKDGFEKGEIDYDKRKRDMWIETNPSMAANTLQQVNSFIQKVSEDKELNLYTEYSEAPIHTTFMRELSYNIDHCVHHMAIIKIALQAICPEVKVPQDFGVARSTIKHRQKTALKAEA